MARAAYTAFIMADHSGRMVITNTKARLERPPALCIFNMATAMAARDSILTGANIPAASLHGRKPSELKNKELKFWLRCRDDPAKILKTKAELVRSLEVGLFTVRFSLVTMSYTNVMFSLYLLFLGSRITLNLEGTRTLWIQILINYTHGENRRKA